MPRISRPILLALAATACATSRPRPPEPSEVRFEEPGVIEAHPEDLDLAGKNDEELFAIGNAAFAAGEYRRAAEAFGRVPDLHPGSRHVREALFRAGLAEERLSEWRLALERFEVLARDHVGREADEASFRAAECDWHLGDLKEARAVLDRLAERKDLEAIDHVRALAQRGIVELEDGEPDQAERSLRLAIAAYSEADGHERLDDYYPAQAQFYLGEVQRGRFEALRIDPSREEQEALARELEQKAQILLSAQEEYLRAIRMGNAGWAVAAGARIGDLYDELYSELVEAPLPPGLDDEQARAYRDALRGKVRILVAKAISVYEQTLATARRTGVENLFVERTQASLERMKQALLTAEESAPR